MRIACLLCLLVLVSGCNSRQGAGARSEPLFAGKLEDGTFWKNPLTATSNEGGGYAKGSRVEVFEPFVVVTTQDGLSRLHPHGYYSNLVVKRN